MSDVSELLEKRYGSHDTYRSEYEPGVWKTLAGRGSVRTFKQDPVDPDLIRHLAALALASPSKSDLQQRDIVIIRDPALKSKITSLIADQKWLSEVPELLIFCGNNRRQRQVHELRGHAFANDHLDAFFNAAVDAGIALSAFVIAAEARGLGCCPISAIRNHAKKVSELLNIPHYIFPIAGLAVGWPAGETVISPRLPLEATVHENLFDDARIEKHFTEYDQRRATDRPYASQKNGERFGTVENYSWSEDKARQYNVPERTDFGDYIRKQGFKLD